MKKFTVSIYLAGMKLPIENKVIEAHNTCSALIIMSGQIATIEKYKGCREITIREQKEQPCNSCQGGGCPVCDGFGYLLSSEQ